MQRTIEESYSVGPFKLNAKRFNYLDDPILMYACQGNVPKPASSPPTIRLCACCLEVDIPQPESYKIIFCFIY